MNETVQAIAVILLIAGILLAGYLIIGNPFDPGNGPSTLTLSSNPSEASVGEEVEFKIETTGKIKKIELTSQVFSETISCTTNHCINSVSKEFENAGVYLVTAKAYSQEETIQKNLTIYVTDSKKRCSDGTAFGQCSKNLPKFCNSGFLVEKCSACGCSDGSTCNGESCSEKILPLTIQGISFSGNQFFKNQSTIASIQVLNGNSDQINGRKYSIEIQFIEPSNSSQNFTISQEFSVDSLGGMSNKTLQLPFGIGGIGTFDAIINESYNGTVIESKTFEKVLTVSLDSTPPSAPYNLSAVVQNGSVNLSWNLSDSEGKELRVYKSNSLQGGYTTYSLHSIVGGGSTITQITSLDSGKHVFVVSAVDLAGNESAYSNIAIADIP